jgi:hypothetical protein
MTETIPIYIKGTGEVLQAEPAPGNQAIQPENENRHTTQNPTERRCPSERKNRQGDAGT